MSLEGATLTIATLMLVVATLYLAAEAQLARLSASVVLQATMWRFNESALATDMSNVGVATAEEVVLIFQWFGPGNVKVGDQRRIELPALIPGERIPYHPDVIFPAVDGKRFNSIEGEAAAGLEPRCEWSWVDGRRDLLWGRKRMTRTLRVNMAKFMASVHGGPQIIENDEVDRLLTGAKAMVRQFETMRNLRGDDTTVAGVSGRRARDRGVDADD